MGALRAPKVIRTKTFDAHVAALLAKYERIEDAIESLVELLVGSWNAQHIPVDLEKHPGVYCVGVDYPALGDEGRGRFLAVYHATPEATNPMSEPLRTYTLLSLEAR